MRDLRTNELAHVYGAGGSSKCAPPPCHGGSKAKHSGSKAKCSKSKSKGSKSKGSKGCH